MGLSRTRNEPCGSCLPTCRIATLLSVTEGRAFFEQTDRSNTRYARLVDSEDNRLAANAWLGDRAAHSTDVWRSSTGRTRCALPRASQTRTERLDQIRV